MELHDEGARQLTALIVVLGGLLALAPTLRIPYPILLVLGGLALGFVPACPESSFRPTSS